MKRELLSLYSRTVARALKTVSVDLHYTPAQELRLANRRLQWLLEDGVLERMEAIKARIRLETPDNPVLDGYKIYSQTDEDGIIAAIFRRLQPTSQTGTFVEIGCADGLQNNSHALALAGWRGAWVDGSTENIGYVNACIGKTRDLLVEECFVTRDNAADLVGRLVSTLDAAVLDFLSLDIDGNDYHVMDAILQRIKPRVVCAEYNPKFPPPLRLTTTYDEAHVWQHDDYHGASLGAWVELFGRHGYTLVTCNLSGANAFFVTDAEADAFVRYPPEVLYQPARYYLQHAPIGHAPSLKFLSAKLARCRLPAAPSPDA